MALRENCIKYCWWMVKKYVTKGLYGEIRVDQGCWLPEGTCRELAKGRDTWNLRGFRLPWRIVKVNTSAVKENSISLKRLKRFSSWLKAKMALALCLRYKRRLRDRVLAKRKLSSEGALESGVEGEYFNLRYSVFRCSPGVNIPIPWQYFGGYPLFFLVFKC